MILATTPGLYSPWSEMLCTTGGEDTALRSYAKLRVKVLGDIEYAAYTSYCPSLDRNAGDGSSGCGGYGGCGGCGGCAGCGDCGCGG